MLTKSTCQLEPQGKSEDEHFQFEPNGNMTKRAAKQTGEHVEEPIVKPNISPPNAQQGNNELEKLNVSNGNRRRKVEG